MNPNSFHQGFLYIAHLDAYGKTIQTYLFMMFLYLAAAFLFLRKMEIQMFLSDCYL